MAKRGGSTSRKKHSKAIDLFADPLPKGKRKRVEAEAPNDDHNDNDNVQAFEVRRTKSGRRGQRELVNAAMPEYVLPPDQLSNIPSSSSVPYSADEPVDMLDEMPPPGEKEVGEDPTIPVKPARYETKSQARGTIHVKLQRWLPLRQSYLNELIRCDGRQNLMADERCWDCGACVGSYRCSDCFGGGICCQSCIVASHKRHPFHRVEVWTGEFFDKISLQKLGLHLQLGHDGRSCAAPSPSHKHFIVMDVSGFHLVNVNFCGCGLGGLPFIQLLRAKLFPASWERPRTAFTFDALATFHELTLQGKTNAYDFYRTILRKTDNSKPPTTFRYNEFAFVVRLWRHLMMLKRGGRGHAPGGADATGLGELAVVCPACPQPGRNLPDGWENTHEDKRWLYALSIAVDANFRLKSKERGLKDIELAPGWAYFVEEEAYQGVVQQFANTDTETNTCRSHHNAILAANLRNTKNYKTSGAGATVCGRHSVVMSVVDLQNGEKYVSMDYTVLSALRKTQVRDLLISYDIACQWSKNLLARIPRYPASLRLDTRNINIRTAVPKFHLPAHGASCQSKFSLNFLPKVGRTYGEGVESEWAHINGTAPSSKEMAPAVRHETLNDHWSGWNWTKILGFGVYFLRKLAEAVEWYKRSKNNLDSLSSTVPVETIIRWEAMITAWLADTNEPDPYAEPAIEMTLNDVRLEFAREDAEEAAHGQISVHALTKRSFLVVGLEIEEKQRTFEITSKARAARTSALAANAQQSRNVLHRQITQWRHVQDIYMSSVAAHRSQGLVPRQEVLDETTGSSAIDIDDKGNRIEPDRIPLLLPSSVPHIASRELLIMESRLRYAQADDALATIRRLRRIITGLRAFKTLNVSGSGNKPNTRVHTLFQRFHLKINQAVKRYRVGRMALLAIRETLPALDPRKKWEARFQYLHDNDVRGPDRDEVLEPSEGRVAPSWIWLVQDANINEDGSLAEFGESVRVEWAKAKARTERWKEEIELLCEEMRRVLAFLDWRALQWHEKKGVHDSASTALRSGLDAYAAKQATIFSRLSTHFAEKWVHRLRAMDSPPNWALQFDLQALNMNRLHSISVFDALQERDDDRGFFSGEGGEQTRLDDAVDTCVQEHSPNNPRDSRANRDCSSHLAEHSQQEREERGFFSGEGEGQTRSDGAVDTCVQEHSPNNPRDSRTDRDCSSHLAEPSQQEREERGFFSGEGEGQTHSDGAVDTCTQEHPPIDPRDGHGDREHLSHLAEHSKRAGGDEGCFLWDSDRQGSSRRKIVANAHRKSEGSMRLAETGREENRGYMSRWLSSAGRSEFNGDYMVEDDDVFDFSKFEDAEHLQDEFDNYEYYSLLDGTIEDM